MTSNQEMEKYIKAIIDEEIATKDFTRNKINNIQVGNEKKTGLTPVIYYGDTDPVEVDDIRDVLDIHLRTLLGCEGRRKKPSEKKVKSVNLRVCPEALHLLDRSRLDITKKIRRQVKLNRRKYSSHVDVWVTDFVEDIVHESYDQVGAFIMEMHKKGEADQDHSDYYIHMVFRHYLRKFHDAAYDLNMVTTRTYQCILDAMYPVGYCYYVHPEFAAFIDRIECTDHKIPRTTIPIKGERGCSHNGVNFESLPGISRMRDAIYWSFRRWTERLHDGDNMVYPTYLQKGSPVEGMGKKIYESICDSASLATSMEKLDDVTRGSLNTCAEKFNGLQTTLYTDSENMFCDAKQPTYLKRLTYFLEPKANRKFFTSFVGSDYGILFDSICKAHDIEGTIMDLVARVCDAGTHWKSVCKEEETRRQVVRVLSLLVRISHEILVYRHISDGGKMIYADDVKREIAMIESSIESSIDTMEVE